MISFHGLTRRRPSRRAWRGGAIVAAIAVVLIAPTATAETIGGALTKAYLSNPDINQQRAAVRASDENIPKANAGYLPTVSAEGDAAVQQFDAQGIRVTRPSPVIRAAMASP